MKKLSTVFLASIFVQFLFAQTFTTYTDTSSGLIHNDVHCADIATNNTVWFGTTGGVAIYDGSTWSSHTTSSDSNLVDNGIMALTILSSGNVWVGTDFGASLYDGSSWTTYTETDGLGDNRVEAIFEDSNGDIYFGTSDGLTLFDGTNWTSWGTSDGLPFGGITHINKDSEGTIWLGTGLGGFAEFDGTDFELTTEDERLINDKVTAVAIDNGDNRWVGTAEGVSVFNDDGWFVENHTIMLVLSPPDTINPVQDVEIASDGNIWAGIYIDYLSGGGVAWFDGASWIDYHVSDGLAGPIVRDLAIDGNDDVWVATSTGVTHITNVPASNNWNGWDNNPAYPEDTVSTYISGFEVEVEMKLFPNPAVDQITLQVSGQQAVQLVEIISMQGQTLKSIETTNQVTVHDLIPGVYLAKVTTGDATAFLRFLKRR